MFFSHNDSMYREVDPAFRPGITSNYYLIRNHLLAGLLRHRKALTGRMMDFGCGQTPYRQLFNHAEYLGVDIDYSGFPEGDKHADVLFKGDRIPFDDGHFDSILCSEVFEHVFDLPGTLQEIHRVLKPGGRMLITCPFMWELHEAPWDFARYTPFALRHALEKAGFEIEVEERLGHPEEAIAQQKEMYFSEALRVRIPGLLRPVLQPILWHICVTARNLCARFKARFYPGYSNIYLSNLMLARKKAD